ncbi:MAG: NAD(P)-dependent oxidoreductase [Salinigranum sp.]
MTEQHGADAGRNRPLGFVGVGNMGSRMTRNLLDAGYEVTVFDLDDERVEAMTDAGAEAADSARAVAESAETVLSSLPTVEAIESAYLGPEGILAGADDGTLLVEMSTTSPTVTARIAEEVANTGVEFVDAPVIGIPPVAAAAELTIMVGGTEGAFERAEPVLSNLGTSVYHVGEVGSGHKSKLLNNMVLLGQYAIAAEAFALAERVGVSQETLYEVITSGVASSDLIEAKLSKALAGDFDPADGSPADNARKDLKYALDMGYDGHFTMPITASVEEHFGLAQTVGEGEKDYSVLLRVLEDLSA